jgi:hypothetical protein
MTASPMRTPVVLQAAAGYLQPKHVINLPLWSTLMLELDA